MCFGHPGILLLCAPLLSRLAEGDKPAAERQRFPTLPPSLPSPAAVRLCERFWHGLRPIFAPKKSVRYATINKGQLTLKSVGRKTFFLEYWRQLIV